MRRFLFASALLIVAPAAVAQQKSEPWTGFYTGVNFGLGGYRYSYPGNGPQPNGAIGTDSTVNTSSGFFGGLQAGYNFQLQNNRLIGAEADFQWSSTASNYSRVDMRTDYEWDLRKTQLRYFGTLRARLGYAFGPIVPYLTGGAAYGRTSALDEEGGDVANGVAEPTTTGRAASVKWGWTVGAGVEYAVDASWRVKAEYLLVDLGTMKAIDHAGTVYQLETRSHTMRVGLNYVWGNPLTGAKPLAPLYDPPLVVKSWTGFHAGANFGLGGNGVHIRYLEAGEGTRNLNSFGFLGGVEAGYDRQFENNMVLGGVIDLQATSISAYRKKIEPPPDPAEVGPVGTNGLKYRIKTLSNIRMRLGYGMGPFLPYVTAGFAGGLLDFNQYDPSDKVSQSQKKTQFQTGFTAGAGFEYALVNNWSFKADYLYYNLGMFRGVEVDLDAFSTKISFSTIRAGLNYRF